MSDAALAGINVLVTRPRHQSGELLAAIAAAGGKAVEFPVIDIVPLPAEQVRGQAIQLADPDIVIFISSNAVTHGLVYAGLGEAKIAAIGSATRSAIVAAGYAVDIFPAGRADSEHLLLEAELLDVTGMTIRIVRGTEGRELLADTLRTRGAHVDYLSVYERRPAEHDAQALAELDSAWASEGIHCAVVMSVDSLRKLVHAVPESCAGQLRKTPLVTPSERVIQTASELLPEAPVQLACGPACDEIMQALTATMNLQ